MADFEEAVPRIVSLPGLFLGCHGCRVEGQPTWLAFLERQGRGRRGSKTTIAAAQMRASLGKKKGIGVVTVLPPSLCGTRERSGSEDTAKLLTALTGDAGFFFRYGQGWAG